MTGLLNDFSKEEVVLTLEYVLNLMLEHKSPEPLPPRRGRVPKLGYVKGK